MKTTTEPMHLPEWLNRWLNMPFYSGSRAMCDKHPKKFNTVYCASCCRDPVCLICWKFISDQHVGDHHHVLEVLKASRRVSIDVRKIRKYLRVSEIQVYSINNNSIVFLNPNPEAAAAPAPSKDDHVVVPKCRTCRRRLIKEQEKFGYRFCSIACKYPREEEEDCDLKKEKIETSLKIKLLAKRKFDSITINDECRPSTPTPTPTSPASAPASLRKRPRKGIPVRAPFM